MKRTALYDLIFYVALPYLIWNQGRDIIGDYYAMLFSTVPGLIYTVFRFIREKQFNITGLFIMVTLLIGTIVDVLSGTAENMLVNGVYVSLGISCFFLFTMLIRKPLALYFFVDMAFLMGYARTDSLVLYKQQGLFHLFQWLTALFAFRGFVQGGVKAWLIAKYGVDGYDQMIIIMQIISWTFTFLIMGAILFINHKIKLIDPIKPDKDYIEHA